MQLKVIPHTKIWFSVSGILLVVSLILLLTWGLRVGIDFTGGSLIELQFAPNQKISATDVINVFKTTEKAVNEKIKTSATNNAVVENDESTDIFPLPTKEENLGEPVIIPLENGIAIRSKPLNPYTHQKIKEAIEQSYPGTIEKKFTTIGATVGDSLRQKAILSLSIAFIGIIAFIAWAFRKIPKKVSPWKFGVSAVIALAHDIIIPLGVFVVLGHFWNVEIESYFVTALLTIMGFSIHDTIVVFDRIRENLIYQKRDETFADIAEKSVQQTMSRSINTSLTTFITLLFLFIFGSESIKWFILTILIGIVIGTYSSIFIASPLLVLWKQKGTK